MAAAPSSGRRGDKNRWGEGGGRWERVTTMFHSYSPQRPLSLRLFVSLMLGWRGWSLCSFFVHRTQEARNPPLSSTSSFIVSFFSFFFSFLFQAGRTPCLFFSGNFLVLRRGSGSVNKSRLRRPREFGRPDIFEGCFTAPEGSVDRILQLQ